MKYIIMKVLRPENSTISSFQKRLVK